MTLPKQVLDDLRREELKAKLKWAGISLVVGAILLAVVLLVN